MRTPSHHRELARERIEGERAHHNLIALRDAVMDYAADADRRRRRYIMEDCCWLAVLVFYLALFILIGF